LCVGKIGCDFPANIIPAASLSHKPFDRNKICSDFCRFHRVTLRGCFRCPFENSSKESMQKRKTSSTASPSTAQLGQVNLFRHQFDATNVDFENLQISSFQASTTETTTPDWNRLCGMLCRQGNGGILCNCDLAPF
jgi:hypothetical protein